MVVPANNEAQSIGARLVALVAAAKAVDVPVAICVVLDDSRDATAGLVASAATDTGADIAALAIEERSVGAARRAGAAAMLDRVGRSGTWLATTDADSEVPVSWLNCQVRHANRGADAVVGAVTVDDWSDRSAHVRAAAEHRYQLSSRHIHGANLGVRSDAYQDVGGFGPVCCHEDVALVRALATAGWRVLWDNDLVVITSARRAGGAPEGFSGFLDALDPAFVSGGAFLSAAS